MGGTRACFSAFRPVASPGRGRWSARAVAASASWDDGRRWLTRQARSRQPRPRRLVLTERSYGRLAGQRLPAQRSPEDNRRTVSHERGVVPSALGACPGVGDRRRMGSGGHDRGHDRGPDGTRAGCTLPRPARLRAGVDDRCRAARPAALADGGAGRIVRGPAGLLHAQLPGHLGGGPAGGRLCTPPAPPVTCGGRCWSPPGLSPDRSSSGCSWIRSRRCSCSARWCGRSPSGWRSCSSAMRSTAAAAWPASSGCWRRSGRGRSGCCATCCPRRSPSGSNSGRR
jgi:hypothetical protein